MPKRKARVEDRCELDVRALHREGKLKPGPAFIRVWRRNGREVSRGTFAPVTDAVMVLRAGKLAEALRLEWTPCYYGGARPWFLCPACSERCAMVYDLAGMFACRWCNDLKHRTTQESRGNRLVLKAKKVGACIGGCSVFPDSFTGKPRGMHWRTYCCTEEKALKAWAAGLMEWEQELERVSAGLGSRASRLPTSVTG